MGPLALTPPTPTPTPVQHACSAQLRFSDLIEDGELEAELVMHTQVQDKRRQEMAMDEDE